MSSENDKNSEDNSDEVIFAVLLEEDENTDIEQEEVEQKDVVVDTFQERRQKQFIAQSRPKRQWVLITLGLLVGLLVISVALLESPLYRIKKVEISSSEEIPIDKLESDRIEALTKPVKGQPMYRTSLEDVKKNISELPTISSVQIDKAWPRSIEIQITKRVPVGFIETDQGVVLVDKNGFVFSKSEEPLVGYPAFEGMDEVEFAKKIPDDTFIEVLNKAPSEIKDQIVLVKIEDGKYSMELTDGIDVLLGDNSSLEQKLAISWSILQAKKRSEIGYIDVSVPSLPVSGSPQLKV